MNVLKIAAFSNGGVGGNPAGVVITDELLTSTEMQRIATEVGFSETVFAAEAGNSWRVRYFSPASEVPFCGHATIALGAALALRHGDDVFALVLNQAEITVEAKRSGNLIMATLQSPPTRSNSVPAPLVSEALSLFGFTDEDLDPRIPPALIHAGADHLLLMLENRRTLASMKYSFDAGRELMIREEWTTILLGHAETQQRFNTRNAFAYGGVYEDPATGAATAALAGYLRDIQWPHAGTIEVVQGEDMGMRSHLRADITPALGNSIRVSGTARIIPS